jgi:hypothetical protein
MTLLNRSFWAIFTLLISASAAYSQVGQDSTRRPIVTAVQFLLISPDARAGGMGDGGVATSSDANSTYWNPSKLAFVEKDMGFAVAYTPWLQNLVNDMWISYLTGYYKINKRQTIAASLKYFSMGELEFTNIRGQQLQVFRPNEFAADAHFAMQLSDNFSMAVGARYIHSNLAGNFTNGSPGTGARPGNTGAVDISGFYTKKVSISDISCVWNSGFNISNIGPRISYGDPQVSDFIPTNMRFGSSITGEIDQFNKITFSLDVNKLLVPTPPLRNLQGNIVAGKDPDRGFFSAMIGSFSDAPDGVKEELKELIYSGGVEYWYNDLFALRGGFFHEAKDKGNRQYFTVGLGLKYQLIQADFSYLIPREQNNPLANTLRFSLLFNFNKGSKSTAPVPEGVSEGE